MASMVPSHDHPSTVTSSRRVGGRVGIHVVRLLLLLACVLVTATAVTASPVTPMRAEAWSHSSTTVHPQVATSASAPLMPKGRAAAIGSSSGAAPRVQGSHAAEAHGAQASARATMATNKQEVRAQAKHRDTTGQGRAVAAKHAESSKWKRSTRAGGAGAGAGFIRSGLPAAQRPARKQQPPPPQQQRQQRWQPYDRSSLRLAASPSSSFAPPPSSPRPPSLRIATTGSSDSFMQRVMQQYAIVRPELRLDVTSYENSVGALTQVVRGNVDAALTSHIPSGSDLARAPDLRHLPLWAYAYVPVTNMPAMSGVQFVLDVGVVCRIYRGNITRWDDPALVDLNPQLRTAGAAAAVPIELVLMSADLTFQKDFTSLCARVDPEFAALITPASKPVWPRHLYARSTLVNNVPGMISHVQANPNSFGLAIHNSAQKLGASFSLMRNSAGATVRPSYQSIDAGFRARALIVTRGANGKLTYAYSGDLSDAPGPSSWPFISSTMLEIPRSFTRTTCNARSELIKLLRWMLDANSIRYTLGNNEATVLLPPELDTHLGLRTTLQNLRCGESRSRINVASSYTITSGGGSVSTTHTSTKDIFALSFASGDSSLSAITNVVSEPRRALDDLLDPQGSMDIAFVYMDNYRAMYPDDLQERVRSARLRFMPQAVYGVIPSYSFGVDTLAALTAAKALPLKVDMETLGGIFTGAIRSWTDPALTSFNPALGVAFSGAAAGSAESQITLVLYGVGDWSRVAHSALSNALMLSLNHTRAVRESGLPWSLPPDWRPVTARLDALGVRYVMVDDELQLEAAVNRIPGAVGYKLAFSNSSNPQTDFAIVRTVQPTLVASPTATTTQRQPYNVTVLGVPTSFRACAAAASRTSNGGDLDLQSVGLSSSPSAARCWPIPLLVSIALPADLAVLAQDALTGQVQTEDNEQALAQDRARLCEHQSRVAQYAQYSLFERGLERAQMQSGFVQLTDVPWIEQLTRTELNGVWCAGQPLLYTPSVVWKLSDGLRLFAHVAGPVLAVLTVAAAVLTLKFRSRTMIRAGDLPLQLSTLAGLIMLLLCPVIYVLEPDVVRCRLLAWLLCIGFSLAFGPIAAKIWRVHATFKQRRSLKAKRISTRRLYAIVATLVTIDIILLASQNSKGALLEPSVMTQMENNRVHEYNQCNPADGALPISVTLFGIKAALLLVTSVLAFGVRHVSSAFGESTNLSWAVWNSTLSCGILLPILALVGEGAGDVHTFLLVFLVMWITGTTLAFAFGRKLATLLLEEWRVAAESNRLSRTSHTTRTSRQTSGTGTGSGTFGTGSSWMASLNSAMHMPSLDGVPLAVLERYLTALETQLRLAKQRRQNDFGSAYQAAITAADESDIFGPRHGHGHGHTSGAHTTSFHTSKASLLQFKLVEMAQPREQEGHAPRNYRYDSEAAAALAAVAVEAGGRAALTDSPSSGSLPVGHRATQYGHQASTSITAVESDRDRPFPRVHSAPRSPGMHTHTHTPSLSSRAAPLSARAGVPLNASPLASPSGTNRPPIRINLGGGLGVPSTPPAPSVTLHRHTASLPVPSSLSLRAHNRPS